MLTAGRQAARLRPREGARAAARTGEHRDVRSAQAHRRGQRHRHVSIHGPRAAGGPASRCPNRSVRLWRRALRDGHRPQGLRGRQSGQPHRIDPDLAAAALSSATRKGPRTAAGTGSHRRALSAEETGRPLADGSRCDDRAGVDGAGRFAPPGQAQMARGFGSGAASCGVGAGRCRNRSGGDTVDHHSAVATPEVTRVRRRSAAGGHDRHGAEPAANRHLAGWTAAGVRRTREGRRQIWVRSLGALDARPVRGTEGAHTPFWSPDSRFIGFFAARCRRAQESRSVGRATTDDLRRAKSTAAAWGRDGTILFTQFRDGLFRVPADGGTPVRVTQSISSKAR